MISAYLAGLALQAATSTSNDAPMRCDQGPLSRAFGGTNWVVYGCEDQRSVVVVSIQGNPAGPFVFIFAVKDDGYSLSGEGTGDKIASAAAFAELSKLSGDAIARLHAEATAAAPKP